MMDPLTVMLVIDTAIGLAPKIAGGAEILWNKVKRKGPPNEPLASEIADNLPAAPASMDSLGVALVELQSEMIASTELLKNLADQNSRIAEFMDATQTRFNVLEDSNTRLVNQLATDRLILKALESQNNQLTKNIESNTAQIKQLIGICLAVAVVALSSLAIAVHLAMK